VPGLGASLGRGGATMAQEDLANSDCILIEGSSMAEAHPVGFRWALKAQQRGAKLIHVDPRFSRTSAMCDFWAPIRAGSDIAFLGALIHYTIENGRYFKEYVAHYTNASCILREDFRDTEDLDGFFSGWEPEGRQYIQQTWHYEGESLGNPRRDMTLEHPRCVFQVLKRHFSRYTPEMVERVAGIPRAMFLKIAEVFTSASGPNKTAAICYSVGWTQHSKGVQTIRAAALLQMLLGNVGRPGGGILSLRGHASIQGSTDIPTLYDVLPGYIPMPRLDEEQIDDFFEENGKPTGLWSKLPNFTISLLKAYYGERATKQNHFGWGWLPRVVADHSHFSFLTEMARGQMEGLFLLGQNPAVGAQNARYERKSLAKLKWLVVRDLVEIESASFWHDSPEVQRGELRTEEIGTEIFLLPAAGHAEKDGSFTNTQRLIQWREKAVEPPGDAKSDAWFIHQLAKRLKGKAEASDDPIDEPMRALDWWYPEDEHGDPVMEAVLAEINGWQSNPDPTAGGVSCGDDRSGRPHHGPQVSSYKELKDDGSTACGCWIYSGVMGPDGTNKARQRNPSGRYGHGWAFAWPADQRILYNRASADPDGNPWSEAKKLVWWDAGKRQWTGDDKPDFPEDKPPDYRPGPDAAGLEAHRGDAPFILHDDGLGWLFAPGGVKDGPLPAHYEPLESPVHNQLYGRETNPPVFWFTEKNNQLAAPGDPRFPHVLTTFRVTEQHTAGGMSRFLSHLSELQPEMFAEISPELARVLGVSNGDYVVVATLRGAVEARALVSRRIRPLRIAHRTIHQVAIPFHFGSAGPIHGGTANDLVPLTGDPNVTIHEGKALVCAVVPGRLPEEKDFVRWHSEFLSQHDPGTPHPEQPPPGAPAGGRRPGGQAEEGEDTGEGNQ
jgi:formate dehydrogenase major subunit